MLIDFRTVTEKSSEKGWKNNTHTQEKKKSKKKGPKVIPGLHRKLLWNHKKWSFRQEKECCKLRGASLRISVCLLDSRREDRISPLKNKNFLYFFFFFFFFALISFPLSTCHKFHKQSSKLAFQPVIVSFLTLCMLGPKWK